MHGRVKTRTTEEQREIARLEKCKKAKAYKESMNIILEKRSCSSCDQEALDLTASLLVGNPDIITLWNYRREMFLNLKEKEDEESYQKLLEKDIGLTEQCLRVNPKSYGSWHHRIWILDNLPHPDWEKELKLCTKYLQFDERNFHCWDYRRIVTQRSNIPDESEYKYTLEKIENNFSNYSAWHLRSKLLPKIFPDPGKRFPIDEEKHREELELVESAAFTDPNDQSAWFYLRWLLGLTEPKVSFVYIQARESEVFVVTSRNVKLGNESEMGMKVRVKINGETVRGHWESVYQSSCVWTFKMNSKMEATDSIQVTLEENGSEYSSVSLQPNGTVRNRPNFHPSFSESLRETLTGQLSSCEQLTELEPESKWTLLTSIFLMLAIDSGEREPQIAATLDRLTRIDPLRRGYYLDLRSKIAVQSALGRSWSSGDRQKFTLTDRKLTAFYHSQYLVDFEEVDLSNNELSSFAHFDGLVKCRILNLNGNRIRSLGSRPVLPNLEILLLDDNAVEEVDEKWAEAFPRLRRISLVNNPISKNENSINELSNRLSDIKFSFFSD